MEIRNLVTFVRITETQNFSRTAEQLGYSQSAVTMQIKQLESELHVQLFERIGKQVKLTQAGERLLPYALEILGAVRQAENIAREPAQIAGKLRIGTCESFVISVLPPVLTELTALCPQVEIITHTARIPDLIQMLRQKNAGYSTENGEIQIFNDTTKELLDTIAEHAAAGAFSTFKISSYPANFLNAGQCIFAIDSTAGATWMGSDAPLSDISEDSFVEFETAVLPVPQFDPEHPQMISQGPSICIFNKEDPQEVLASWLFTQYLLTNDVQIAYSQTEGYVPVTSKAQESAEYQDYLSRAGEDNDLYYDVKIQASQLLLDHMDDTFITPVFNGSASLRDAAGQMIENVTKSVRRKETVDDAYMEKLFADMDSLYHLSEHEAGAAQKADLGPLPKASVLLLSVLSASWILILLYVLRELMKKKKRSH